MSPGASYAEARGIAVEVMKLGVPVYGNKKSATDKIPNEYGLGRSWFRKLFHGEPVTIHRHLYVNLCIALEELNDRHRARVAHNDRILEKLRSSNAAFAGDRRAMRDKLPEGAPAV